MLTAACGSFTASGSWIFAARDMVSNMTTTSLLPSFLYAAVLQASTLELHAQCTPTDVVTGSVVDITNAGVPASVTLSGRKPVQTNEIGLFQLTCVPLGSSTLLVQAPGFEDKTSSLIKKNGPAAGLNVVLAIAAVKTSIDVTADGSSTANGKSIATSELNRRQIDALPDDPDQFEAQLRALASSGGGPEDVSITVDGFQSSSAVPPKSAIDHIKINPTPFSAEYSSVLWPGGRIEIYTKPGAAAFHGSVFANGSLRALNATDPFSTAAAPAGNQRLGFDLSGPLMPKTSFSIALEKRNIDEQSVTDATVLGENGSPTPLQTTVDTPERLWIGSARLDWQAYKNNIAAMSFAANVNDAENQGVGGLTMQEAGYRSENQQYVVHLSDTEQFTPQLLQETRVGYTWNDASQAPNSLAPSLNVAGFFLGGGTPSGSLKRRSGQLELDDVLEYTHRAFTFRFGTQISGTSVRDSVPDTFNGAYLFGGQTAPVLDGNGNPTSLQESIDALEQYRRATLGLAGGTPTSYEQTSGNVLVPFYQWQQAFFVQQTVKVPHRVTIETGLRYQFQTEPSTRNNFAPRAGVTWAIDSKAKWVAQVDSGIFTEALPVTYARETERLNGVRQQQVTVYSPQYGSPLSSQSSAAEVSATNMFSPVLHQPDYVETLIGLDHVLGRGWTLSALTDFGQNWGGLRLRNINAPIVSPSLGPVSVTTAVQSLRPFGPGRNLFQYETSGHMNGEDLDVRLSHTSKSFTLTARYVWMKAIGDQDDPAVTSPQNSYSDAGEKSRVLWDYRERFLLVSTVSLPSKLQLATQVDLKGGLPYDVVTGTDANGDGTLNDRPSLIAIAGPDTYSTRYGLLTTNATNGNAIRNLGTMPAIFHTALNLSRTFLLERGNPSGARAISINVRGNNILNHTNVTAVDPVVGSSTFDQGVAAEAGRRIEGGVRFSF